MRQFLAASLFVFATAFMLNSCAGLGMSVRNPRTITAVEAESSREGMYVRITGNVSSILLFEYFVFTDETGRTTVEIGMDTWDDLGLDPNTMRYPIRMEIVGIIDRGPQDRHRETVVKALRVRVL